MNTLFKKIDIPFLSIILLLVGGGFLIFSSASLGLLAREAGASMSSVAFNQIVLGLGGGTIALCIALLLPITFFRKFGLYFFILGLVITAFVFVPGIGFEANGAHRWIHIGSFSFQPAEPLKFAFIFLLASLLAGSRNKLATSFLHGALPLLGMLGLVGGVLLAQPDTGTFMIFCAAGIGMFIAAGARARDMAVIAAVGIVMLSILAFMRPYVMERMLTFMNPADDPLGSGYQVQQSLIAIGSGGMFGRGFGQSVQKFNFLPEPISDSIFAVAAEEFGLFGACIIILVFVLYAWRGLYIAARAPDPYSGLVVVGIVILVMSEAFLNIGSMLGVMPLTGVPLPFISHGGTALLFMLFGAGIILRVSKFKRKI